MSKKSKKLAQAKRLSMKRARKESAQKQYQQWAAEGKNKLSKRTKLNKKRASSLRVQRHAGATCDNIGCRRCVPELNTPMYAQPGSFLYKRRFMKRAKQD